MRFSFVAVAPVRRMWLIHRGRSLGSEVEASGRHRMWVECVDEREDVLMNRLHERNPTRLSVQSGTGREKTGCRHETRAVEGHRGVCSSKRVHGTEGLLAVQGSSVVGK